jgi:hypothetical protein
MNIKHPLESVFNMQSGSVDINVESQYEIQESPLMPQPMADGSPAPDVKDEDDVLVEKRIDEVYDAAMTAYQNQSAYTEIIEPRYAARNAEVAANYLNIALAAANSRARVKVDRKRANQQFIPHGSGGKTTNNIVIANREEILKMITIDSEKKQIE